jgi:acyl dehydratase
MTLLTPDILAWVGTSIAFTSDPISLAEARRFVAGSGDDHPDYPLTDASDGAHDGPVPPMLYYGATRPFADQAALAEDGTVTEHRPFIGSGQTMGGSVEVEWRRPLGSETDCVASARSPRSMRNRASRAASSSPSGSPSISTAKTTSSCASAMSRYFSDAALPLAQVSPGVALPPLRKDPTAAGVVLFCAAIRNYHRLHYDMDFAQRRASTGTIVPGFLMGNWCVEAVMRGLEPGLRVARLRFRNTRVAYLGGAFEIRATIASVEMGASGPTLSPAMSRSATLLKLWSRRAASSFLRRILAGIALDSPKRISAF